MKIILMVVFLIGVVFIGGCSLNKTKNTPEKKVEQLEKEVENTKETSGFNACVKKINDASNRYEKDLKECITKYVEAEGYTDGVNCLEDCNLQEDMTYSEDQQRCNVCKNTKRYNADVYGLNKCNETIKPENQLTLLDCQKLLENK